MPLVLAQLYDTLLMQGDYSMHLADHKGCLEAGAKISGNFVLSGAKDAQNHPEHRVTEKLFQ